ncbi:lysophospholipid acyltransferase family protein [Maribellus sediminis]|uniref:lysophospholipid acyltransferase family protein n=1 Tax=Maribellus sediminis TaxID=2696285 RepID=UPI001430A954|nr:lysophospholipid acyltransferase family protein [Maribellus sediminis]
MQKKKENTVGFFENLGNHAVVLILKFFALLPLSFLYLLSDFIHFLLRNVVNYRSVVIIDNLKHAFPEKSDEEILAIRNKFYRHFADLFIESMKMYGMSEKEMNQRVRFKGLDMLNNYAEKGQSIIVLAYHHHNWEWASFIQTVAKHRILMVYNKMRKNQPMDDFLLKSREKWGGLGVQMGRSAKVMFDLQKKNIPTLTWLAADQSALPDQGMWANFFNREAAFFAGPEKIARKTNQPVLIQRVHRLGRGKYEYEFTLLCEEPAEAKPYEVLLSYIQKMEEVLKEEPEYYLWSHRRWKHKRPENLPLIQ